MFPDPFHIGPLRIAPYGIMVALGLLAAIVLGGRENQRIKLMAPELWEKVALWTVLWGLIVSRLFYVFTELDRFLEGPLWKIFAIWEGGLVFYGGPIGAVLYLCWHFVIRRHPPMEQPRGSKRKAIEISMREGWTRMLRFFDLGAPLLALAHAFGRIGCLFAGCCYGAAHEGPLALHYPENSPAYAGGIGRYPIPVLESGIEFTIFAWLFFHVRLKKRFHGQVMLQYVMLYPAARFVLEMFRGDAIRGYVFRLETPGLNEALGLDPNIPVMMTTSQFISLIVVTLSAVLIIVGKRVRAEGMVQETVWWEDEDEDDEDEDGEYEDGEYEDEDDDDDDEDAQEAEAERPSPS